MIKVLVLPGVDCSKPFRDMGFETYYGGDYHNIKNYNLICFSGGTDVNPELYGQENTKSGHPDKERDSIEMDIFSECFANKIPMVGICRGFQFLNVMNGGSLYQHINGHGGGSHTVEVRDFLGVCTDFLEDGRYIQTNSTHHQLVNLGISGGMLLAEANPRLSDVYYTDTNTFTNATEVEAACWTRTRSIGVQYHPEWMNKNSSGVKYFESLVNFILNLN